MRRIVRRPRGRAVFVEGFSLLEIMIALTLGLLLSIGIVTLFSGTSRTNKLQDGLARLQENGRFAVTRMEQDLRMFGGQYCSNTTGASAPDTAVPMVPARAPMVYASDLQLPDSAINSIDANGNPTDASATAAYILSPRWFIQGYSCTASTCTPSLPSGSEAIPDMGLAAGRRVPASDVLTIRYQRGTGWTVPLNACSVAAGADLADGDTIQVSPQDGDDPISGMTPGLALISDCVSPVVLPISAVSGNLLTIGAVPQTSSGILAGASGFSCKGNRTRDVRLFNFSADFVTVSYYLAFREDDNPDARPNGGGDTRLIPVLIRREKGVEQELVRGVDELVFRYGVQDRTGKTQFMSAADVNVGTECSPPPPGLNDEPGCMWRTVRSIESHLLVNTVDDIGSLDQADRRYSFDGDEFLNATSLPSGLSAGNQLRREFIAYVTVRNRNF
ncbi:PilW family protein [Dokdonella sp.]|uniref:PilW family protein n=1 Tax=Dokdonella sp. TaxID=2291710 RepID=UPI001B1697C0|nr:PilW family protein [Dokdonella sp.]MBO9662413.1 PilW family protein [Dokdonella sp.]